MLDAAVHGERTANDDVMYDYDVAVFLDDINAALNERNPETRRARQELVRQIETGHNKGVQNL